MKKIGFVFSLCFLSLFTVVTSSSASELASGTISYEITDRTKHYTFSFKNYPPKNYKGFILCSVEKTKTGYIGIYI